MARASTIAGAPVRGIELDDLADSYAQRRLDRLSDTQLAAAVADVVRVPRCDPADSFVLHAPLELEARLALLPLVAPDRRHLARLHIVAIAAQYEAFGPPIDDLLSAPRELRRTVDPLDWLLDATTAGDLDEVDRAAAGLASKPRPEVLAAALIDDVAPRTAAAGHAPIFLYHLRRVSPRGELTAELLRPLARSLATAPEWRVRWFDDFSPASAADPSSLDECLRTVPMRGVPGSDFIHPLLMQIDHDAEMTAQLAASVGSYTDDAARSVLRVAAASMLVEPPDHAPYGWTHCLTLPQALLGLAGVSSAPDRLLAMAATHVAAFRAALGTQSLGPIQLVDPDRPAVDPHELATAAAVSHDAHIAKYVLSCLDAASFDPGAAGLYLAAAQRLLDVWATRDDPSDPIGRADIPIAIAGSRPAQVN
ncbi:MAG: hypothetical protein AAGF73_09990 [Actinomycetota bacterium]